MGNYHENEGSSFLMQYLDENELYGKTITHPKVPNRLKHLILQFKKYDSKSDFRFFFEADIEYVNNGDFHIMNYYFIMKK